jgi:GxxExxY protein
MNTFSNRGYTFEGISYEVIGACIEVQRQLGPHCMEVDYQRALELALPARRLEYQREVEIPIMFDGRMITKRRVDFLVWTGSQRLILEIKAKHMIDPEDIEQCLLYLRQGNYQTCLLINFGQIPLGKRRFVHSEKPKGII